jgi:hypothetical protein
VNRLRASTLVLLSAVLLAGGCGDDDKGSSSDGSSGDASSNVFGKGGDCQDSEPGLEKAARDHVAYIKVAEDGRAESGSADRITVDVCRSAQDEATATVTVFGLRDDSIRDIRHEMRLIKSGGIWQVTDDQDSQRCQAGRGQQEFSGSRCQ